MVRPHRLTINEIGKNRSRDGVEHSCDDAIRQLHRMKRKKLPQWCLSVRMGVIVWDHGPGKLIFQGRLKKRFLITITYHLTITLITHGTISSCQSKGYDETSQNRSLAFVFNRLSFIFFFSCLCRPSRQLAMEKPLTPGK